LRSPPLNHIYLWSGWIDKLNATRGEARCHPQVFLRITHISESILSILTKLCPNVSWVILFQSYVRYVWGSKKGPSGGLKVICCPLKLDDILNSLYITYTCRKIFPIYHTCMTCLFFSFLLIYKTRPNEIDLQLSCCISDAFSIFYIFASCFIFVVFDTH
jgi:hypothetical protein